MKYLKKIFVFVIAIFFIVISFSGCTNGLNGVGSGGEADVETTESNVSFNAVSRMAYIGGSLVYNPGNIGYGQLYDGVKVAIRTSSLKTNEQTVTVYTDNLDTEVVTEYSNKADSIKFGYLTVSSVSKDIINFSYTKYNVNGNVESTTNHSIKAGESVDITGDGKDDLKYSALVPARNDFEEAMLLTFISSSEDLYTTMYATIKADNPSRAAIESSLYGVNPNGEFIYIVGFVDSESRAITSSNGIPGIAHGDYVIAESSGEYYSTVGNDSAFGYDLKSVNDYNGEESDFFFELEPFLTYFYTDEQFASDTGAIILLKKMPETLWGDLTEKIQNETCTQQEAVDKLNEILVNLSSIYEISEKIPSASMSEDEKNSFVEAQKEFILSLFPGIEEEQLEDEEKFEKYLEDNNQNYSDLVYIKNVSTKYLTLVAMSRLFIEKHFPESPHAIVEVPDVTMVFPILSMDLGDAPEPDVIDESEDSVIDSERSISYTYPRTAKEEYADYKKKKEKIDKDFGEFKSISLTKISIDDYKNNENNTTSNSQAKATYFMKTYHADLKLGVTGSYDILWGKIECNLAGAVYLSIGIECSDIAEQYLNLYKEDFLDANYPMMIGPVPILLCLGGDFKLDCDMKMTSPFDVAVGYTAMYGAGVRIGANYGVSIKRSGIFPIPRAYFDPYFDPYLINNTASFAGPTGEDSSGGSYLIDVIPSFTLKPGIKLGSKYSYIGTDFPITASAHIGLGFFAPADIERFENDYWSISKQPPYLGGRLMFGLNVSVAPVIGVEIPVIKKKIATSWKAITIVDKQFAFKNMKLVAIEKKK